MQRPRDYLGGSRIGEPCARKLVYELTNAPIDQGKGFDGRMLRIFEAGVGLARRCAGQLEDAERRVEILVREGEKWLARPFEPEEVAEEAGEGD